MSIGLLGKKLGMTREFIEPGISIPVTVLFVEKGRIIDVITKEKRGYEAIKIGTKYEKTGYQGQCKNNIYFLAYFLNFFRFALPFYSSFGNISLNRCCYIIYSF